MVDELQLSHLLLSVCCTTKLGLKRMVYGKKKATFHCPSLIHVGYPKVKKSGEKE